MDDALRRDLDRNEIIQLAWTYGKNIDTGDTVGWTHLFVKDVKFSYQGGIEKFNCRDELLDFVARVPSWSEGGAITHVMSNVVVEFDDLDPDHARGRTTGVAYMQTSAGMISTRGLHYDDVYVRTPEGWRFEVREHYVDWEYQTPAHRIEVVGRPGAGNVS